MKKIFLFAAIAGIAGAIAIYLVSTKGPLLDDEDMYDLDY